MLIQVYAGVKWHIQVKYLSDRNRSDNLNCYGICPRKSLRDGADACCRHVFVRSAQQVRRPI